MIRKDKCGKQIWTKGSSKGVADIQAIIMGSPGMIEIKFGRDRLSPAQERYKKAIEGAGGCYLVVRKFEDFLEFLNNAKGLTSKTTP